MRLGRTGTTLPVLKEGEVCPPGGLCHLNPSLVRDEAHRSSSGKTGVRDLKLYEIESIYAYRQDLRTLPGPDPSCVLSARARRALECSQK